MNTLNLLTPVETAALLRVHRSTLWRNRKILPKPVTIGGGKKFYRIEDINEFLDNQKGNQNAVK